MYRSEEELKQFRRTELFTVKEGDHAEFYRMPLQGIGVLSKISAHKHLSLVVRSKDDPDKIMSMGFYPDGGDIIGATFSPKAGYLWSPDPHYIPTVKGFKRAHYHKSDRVILYTITKDQADLINRLLNGSECRLKDGSTSRGTVKRDRIECPVNEYRYSPFPWKGCRNCITWLNTVFPGLIKDIDG